MFEAPLYPERCEHVLVWFFELHGRRSVGPHGPAALSWVDIHAWSSMTGQHPTPWELRVIARLDAAYFAAMRARQDRAD